MFLKLNRLADLAFWNIENISNELRASLYLDRLRYCLGRNIDALQNRVTKFNARMNYDVRRYLWPRRPFNGFAVRIKNYIVPKRLHDHRRHFVVFGSQIVDEHQPVSQRYLCNDLAFVCFEYCAGSEWMRML